MNETGTCAWWCVECKKLTQKLSRRLCLEVSVTIPRHARNSWLLFAHHDIDISAQLHHHRQCRNLKYSLLIILFLNYPFRFFNNRILDKLFLVFHLQLDCLLSAYLEFNSRFRHLHSTFHLVTRFLQLFHQLVFF